MLQNVSTYACQEFLEMCAKRVLWVMLGMCCKEAHPPFCQMQNAGIPEPAEHITNYKTEMFPG